MRYWNESELSVPKQLQSRTSAPEREKGNMTPKSLSRKIKKLRIRAPITASYERALMARGVWSNEGVW